MSLGLARAVIQVFACAFLLVCTSCASHTRRLGAPTPPPTKQEIWNAEYLATEYEPVRLQDGVWRGVQDGENDLIDIKPDSLVFGDIDGDGQNEAIVEITEHTGVSGQYRFLALFDRENGKVRNIANLDLGDRQSAYAIVMSPGRLEATMTVHGSHDALCCASEVIRSRFTFAQGTFAPDSETPIGRAPWVFLEPHDLQNSEVKITLGYDQSDRFTGSAGCNRYSAAVKYNDKTATIWVSPAITTRRACSPELMQAEQTFLRRIQAAKQIRNAAEGDLEILYQLPNESGSLSFAH